MMHHSHMQLTFHRKQKLVLRDLVWPNLEDEYPVLCGEPFHKISGLQPWTASHGMPQVNPNVWVIPMFNSSKGILTQQTQTCGHHTHTKNTTMCSQCNFSIRQLHFSKKMLPGNTTFHKFHNSWLLQLGLGASKKNAYVQLWMYTQSTQ